MTALNICKFLLWPRRPQTPLPLWPGRGGRYRPLAKVGKRRPMRILKLLPLPRASRRRHRAQAPLTKGGRDVTSSTTSCLRERAILIIRMFQLLPPLQRRKELATHLSWQQVGGLRMRALKPHLRGGRYRALKRKTPSRSGQGHRRTALRHLLRPFLQLVLLPQRREKMRGRCSHPYLKISFAKLALYRLLRSLLRDRERQLHLPRHARGRPRPRVMPRLPRRQQLCQPPGSHGGKGRNSGRSLSWRTTRRR